MKWQLFENKIKEKLSGHRTGVDVDALWNTIEPDVDAINAQNRNKRRGLVWFLFFGLLLLGSSVGFYFLNNTENEKLIKNRIEKIADGNLLNDNKEVTSPNTDRNENNEKSILALKILEKDDTGGVLYEYNEKPKQQLFNGINKPNNETINQNRTEIILNSVAGKNTLLNNPNGKLISESIIIENIQNVDLEKTQAPMVRTPELIQKLKTAPLSFLIYEKEITAYFTKPISLVETKPIIENPADLVLPEEKRHRTSKNAVRFSVGLNAGISYADRSLGEADSVGNEYLKIRETTEKSLETVHFGLQFNARHKSGFEITSGIQYTRITELFEIENETVNTDSIPGIKYYGVNPNNDTIPVFGMVPHTTTIQKHKKYYNRYTMFDIPVLVGYHHENGNWSLGAQAGIFANISLKASGRFLIDESEDVDIEPNFKSSVGLSYYIGFSAGYKLSDNLEINISPYVRHFTKNFTQPSYSLSQKYTLYGINAGINYWF